jgi:hypothetical protein
MSALPRGCASFIPTACCGFRPDADIATLRAYLRQRQRLVEYAAAHIQHMPKALMEMNLQLHIHPSRRPARRWWATTGANMSPR